jgi:hypothetical protein
MISVFFIPESPRFLMANGREEEAHAFLTKYHGNGRSDSKLVSLQIAEMREGIRQDGIDKTWWDCELPVNFSRKILAYNQTDLCSTITMVDGEWLRSS